MSDSWDLDRRRLNNIAKRLMIHDIIEDTDLRDDGTAYFALNLYGVDAYVESEKPYRTASVYGEILGPRTWSRPYLDQYIDCLREELPKMGCGVDAIHHHEDWDLAFDDQSEQVAEMLRAKGLGPKGTDIQFDDHIHFSCRTRSAPELNLLLGRLNSIRERCLV